MSMPLPLCCMYLHGFTCIADVVAWNFLVMRHDSQMQREHSERSPVVELPVKGDRTRTSDPDSRC